MTYKLPEPCNKGQSLVGGASWEAWKPLFTADQVLQAYRDGLEEALKVANSQSADAAEGKGFSHKAHESYPEGYLDASNEIAWAIEALMETPNAV